MALRRSLAVGLALGGVIACSADYEPKDAWVTAPVGSAAAGSEETSHTDGGKDTGGGPVATSSPTDPSGATTSGPAGDPPPPASPKEALCQHLGGLPPPAFDPASVADWWEDFATAYPNRDHAASNNLAAGQFLRSELETAGYETQILELSSNAGTVRVVEGIKSGLEHPERFVALGAHYDVVTGTSAGAYDNASGVAVQMTLCKMLAHANPKKSIACLFFDAEEIGRVASQRYVAEVATQTGGRVFDQMFGYDMVGLNAPGMQWKLYASLGLDHGSLAGATEAQATFVDTALFDCMVGTLDVDPAQFELLDYYDKRSDEASFMDSGIPAIRFAGGREANDYNGYHNQADTVPNVLEVAGGRASFAAGMAFAVRVSYYTIMAFDAYDPIALPDVSE